MQLSKEYIGAIVILIIGVLQIFKIDVAPEAVTGIITGVLALYLAFKRHGRNDISLLGVRKPAIYVTTDKTFEERK